MLKVVVQRKASLKLRENLTLLDCKQFTEHAQVVRRQCSSQLPVVFLSKSLRALRIRETFCILKFLLKF